SGALTGTGTLAGTGTFEWTGGTIVGASLTVGAAAQLALNNGADRSVDGATVSHYGTGVVRCTNTWSFVYGGVFNNFGLLTFASDPLLYFPGYGSQPAFNNAGTLRKNGSSGRSAFHTDNGGTRLNNTGTVDVQQGTLALGGGGLGSGTWNASAGALLEFTGNTLTLTNGTVFQGAGLSRINGGRVNFEQGVSVTGTLELTNGWWGGGGVFTGTGTLGWQGGTIDGLVNVGPALTLVLSTVNGKLLDGGVITNHGAATWNDGGQVNARYGARVDNLGTWNTTADATFYFEGYGAAPVFNNYAGGTLRQGGGTNGTRFLGDNGGWVLNNAGLLDAQAGVLSLEQGSKNLLHGGSVAGAYRVRSLGGTLTVSGTNTLGAGATLELASGALTGTGTLAGSGTFEWTGGTIVGASLTVGAAAQLALNNGADRSVDGATVNHYGTGVVRCTNTWSFVYGGVFNNFGLLTFESDPVVYFPGYGSQPAFNNAANATIRKTGSTNALVFSGASGGVLFNNSGLLDVRQGAVRVDSPNSMASTASTRFVIGGTQPAAGYSQEFFGGTANLNGTLHVSLTNGFLPNIGDSFALVQYAGQNGSFSATSLPALSRDKQWRVNYGATALTLLVEQSRVISSFTKSAGGAAQFDFNGPAAASAVLEGSINLTNWIALQTNSPFTGTIHFTDPLAASFSNRFYRVIIQE
ncbi:MAG: hypothetical protein HZA89_01200, partial [Verrucomicrobia bacterium]|nr:hypothetical protein [Verrucomicrobiota bacterium]